MTTLKILFFLTSMLIGQLVFAKTETCYIGKSFQGYESGAKIYNLKICEAEAWRGGKRSHIFNHIRMALSRDGNREDFLYLHNYLKEKKSS